MSEPFIGEIRMFGGNFPPRNWAFCDGQLLAISQNTALFSLFGTTYGGDGQTTFALPDLRGRIPLHRGHGPGLANRAIGERSGTETVTLTASQLPVHTHSVLASSDPASNAIGPEGAVTGDAGARQIYAAPSSPPLAMDAGAVASAGGGQPHDNMAPYLAIQFIVALFGIYPSQS
jgi:microcystin-dependent protein